MTSQSRKTPHWFEKTVEYAFVMHHAPSLTCAAPLNGNHERAADAIFAIQNAKWLLIEFKRKASDFGSEEKKFIAHDLAKEALSVDGERLHFFVYGVHSKDDGQLVLRATSYWDQTPVLSIQELLEKKGSPDHTFFMDYLKRLVDEKVSKQGSQGGPDYSLIAAVTEDGCIQTIASLTEVLAPTPTLSNENTSAPSDDDTPTLGM